MKLVSRLAAISLLLAAGVSSSAVTFDFEFDLDPTPGIQPPIVGTGEFTFANDPGDGTFAFTDLGAYSMSYTFPSLGGTFTEADITSDLSKVLVVLSTAGADRRLQFSDTGAGAGGSANGSLDLAQLGLGILSFEPSYYGQGLRLYLTLPPPTVGPLSGDYLALARTSVPDGGSTLLLVGLGALALTGAKLRRR